MLAIVIPYYKIDFFQETLQSLADQSCQDFTVYIGNDNSPVDPTVVLEQFKDKLQIKYQKFETNLGKIALTHHWQRCLNSVQNAQWVMILGDDDVLETNVVDEFYSNLHKIETQNCKVVRFASQKITAHNDAVSDVYKHPLLEKATDFLVRKHLGETRSSLSEYIFHFETLQQVKFKNFPLAWHSDVVAVLEVSNFNTIYSINNALVKIRISSLSISGSETFSAQKRKANVQYALFLLNHVNYFSPHEFEILKIAENTYLNNKKALLLVLKIKVYYILHCQWNNWFNFLKKIV
jgi:glycosyltransferase involved in cell wall biosynthesis